MKQYQLVAVVLSIGVALGILLSLLLSDNGKGAVSSVKFTQPAIQNQAAVRNNKILIPSPTDLNDQSTFGQVKAVASEAETLDFESLAQKLLLAKDDFGGDLDAQDPYLFRIYVKRMVMLNPTETIKFLESYPVLTRYFFSSAFCDWIENDLNGALQYFLSDQESNFLMNTWRCFFRYPEIENHPDFAQLEERVGQPFIDRLELQRISLLPPAVAFEAARLLKGDLGRRAMTQAARRWAKLDLAGFLQVISALPQSNDIQNVIHNSLSAPLKDNLIPTLRLIEAYLTLAPWELRHLVRNAVRAMSFDEARSLLSEYTAEVGDSKILVAVSDQLFKSDPAQALAFFQEFTLRERQDIYKKIAQEYAKHSPDEALTWVTSLDNSFSRAKDTVFREVAHQDIALLERQLLTLQPSMNRRLLFIALAVTKAEQDHRNAIEWIADYKSEPGYGKAAGAVFAQWMYIEPWEAAEYIKTNLVVENEQIKPMSQLVLSLARQDFQRAEAYVDSLPASVPKQQAISGLARAVANSDPEAAYAMVNNLENREIRETAVWQIATLWASREPDRIDEIANLMELGAEQTAQLQSEYLGRH